MDETLRREQLRESQECIEALRRQVTALNDSLQQVLRVQEASRLDYEKLVDATRVVTAERDALRERGAELEAMNRRLVDMLWGRRSERRSESPDQRRMDFGDGPAEPPSAEEQVVIAAQQQADEEQDQELLKRLKRGARPAGQSKSSRAAKTSRRPSSAGSGLSTSPKTRNRASN